MAFAGRCDKCENQCSADEKAELALLALPRYQVLPYDSSASPLGCHKKMERTRHLWHPSRDDTRARGATVRCHEAPHNPRGAFIQSLCARVLFRVGLRLSSLRVLRWRFRQATAAGPHPSSPHYPPVPGPGGLRASRSPLLLLESSPGLPVNCSLQIK